MKLLNKRNSDELVTMLTNAQVGVLLTDTIYGIVASVHSESAVERVYQLRNRDTHKPCIVLIDSIEQIWDKDVPLQYESLISRYWPGRVSIVLPVANKTPEYIHRNFNGKVAFRMPDDPELRDLLSRTGPLIAPSANIAGAPPANDIQQAQSYFGENVDFYVDSGLCKNAKPSQIITLRIDGTVEELR